LFWAAVWSLLWPKRNILKLESGAFSSFVGTFLLALVLLKSTFISGYDVFLRISPLISALGVALLASGFKGLKQYWRELLILCFLAPSPGAMALLIDISKLTAKFATVILWYLGFNVSNQGVYVNLPTGGVEVYSGCSGIESILYMLGLAVVFLVMFDSRWHYKIIVPVVAIFIAFVVNGFRVALMAVLVANSTKEALEYWHKGDGSMLFSMVSVLIFGLFCLFILPSETLENDDASVDL
jgi:cyanoexosortase A